MKNIADSVPSISGFLGDMLRFGHKMKDASPRKRKSLGNVTFCIIG